MDTKEEQRLKFIRMIVSSLEENPEWLNDTLNAISSGMDRALRNANERQAQYDLAFRCALSLADPRRLNQDTKDLLNQKIAEIIGEPTCGVEKEFIKRIANEAV